MQSQILFYLMHVIRFYFFQLEPQRGFIQLSKECCCCTILLSIHLKAVNTLPILHIVALSTEKKKTLYAKKTSLRYLRYLTHTAIVITIIDIN